MRDHAGRRQLEPLGAQRRAPLKKQFEAAGFKINIQNAQNDTEKYATIAQQMLTSGCNLMVLTDLNGAGIQVAQKAKAQGIPVIAYDRPIKGADYYVSFDNFHVGELEGQMIVDGLKAAGKDPKTAKVVYSGGDPTDGNAAQFYDGANKVMTAAGIKPAFKTPGTWDQQKSQTYFEQAYTSLNGNVDAVWAANDTNAGSAITVLDKNGKKVPVSGQDATPPGLQNVLLGKQYGTVYKPYQLEAAGDRQAGRAAAEGREADRRQEGPGRDALHRRDAHRRDHEEHAAGVRRRQRQGHRRVHRQRQGRLREGTTSTRQRASRRSDDGRARRAPISQRRNRRRDHP